MLLQDVLITGVYRQKQGEDKERNSNDCILILYIKEG